MRTITRKLLSRIKRRNEHGITLIEMTISVALLTLLTGTAFSIMLSTQTSVRFTSKETESLDAARTTLGRIGTEVRDALKFYDDADCTMSICLTLATQDPVTGSIYDVRYRYDSVAKILYRSTGARNALTGGYLMSSTDVPAVSNVVNGATAVFCRNSPCTVPSEKAVEIVLMLNVDPAKPSQTVTLRTYATPRNQT